MTGVQTCALPISTGITPIVNTVGGSATQGVDSYVFIQGPPAVATLYASNGRTLSLNSTVAGDSLIVYVPYSKLSDDGNMAITTLIGTNRPMDFASNTGVILSRVPAGITANVMAVPSSGAVLRQIPVRWGKR